MNGRTRSSVLLLVVFFSIWIKGITRSLRVGDKLVDLLRICFGPHLRSRESSCLVGLVACTLARTLLSMATADCSGRVAKALTEGRWRSFAVHISVFSALGVPAAGVHAGLKYFTRLQALLFQRRLSQEVNSKYIRGANFFKASNLPGCKIDNVDQRVTTDVERFADSASSLLTTVFKPVLDVVLLATRLGRQLGVHAPACVIGSSLALSQAKLMLLPDVKRLAQRESELAGLYRNAHARLIASAEEIAFFRGGLRERALLDELMVRITRASVQLARKQLLLGVLDHYLIKYVSPCVAWLLQARRRSLREDDSLGNVVGSFVRTGSLLADLGSAVGHLVQASTKVASLAGITTRVSEVLDAVRRLEAAGNEPFLTRLPATAPAAEPDCDDGRSTRDMAPPSMAVDVECAHRGVREPPVPAAGTAAGSGRGIRSQSARRQSISATELAWLGEWRQAARRQPRESEERDGLPSSGAPQIISSIEGGQMRRVESFSRVASVTDASTLLELGSAIQFEQVAIASPDGQLLVRGLNFCLPAGSSVLLTGPNGSGKSAIVRVLGDLWPIAAGRITKPPLHQLLFVPQRPYLVLGTLRDQLIYPHSRAEAVAGCACAAAAVVLATSTHGGCEHLAVGAAGAAPGKPTCAAAEAIVDDLLRALLRVVDPGESILSQFALDDVRDWSVTLSGGQKQRAAMARLFYHRPRYAVLDECTSAVSGEVEARIYQACRALGTSLFTVSHRVELMRRFHDYELRLDGKGGWEWRDVNQVNLTAGVHRPPPPVTAKSASSGLQHWPSTSTSCGLALPSDKSSSPMLAS